MTYRFGAVILAAGESRRMGRVKQLLPWGDSTVIGSVLTAVRLSPVAETVVVLGHAAEDVAAAIRQSAPAAGEGYGDMQTRILVNSQYREGMLSSVQAGVQALSPACHAFFLFLGDQPSASPAVAAALVEAYRPGAILIPTHEGHRGHPVLFDLSFRDEILRLDPAVGLRHLQRTHPQAVQEVAVAVPQIHMDLDTPADYEEQRPRR